MVPNTSSQPTEILHSCFSFLMVFIIPKILLVCLHIEMPTTFLNVKSSIWLTYFVLIFKNSECYTNLICSLCVCWRLVCGSLEVGSSICRGQASLVSAPQRTPGQLAHELLASSVFHGGRSWWQELEVPGHLASAQGSQWTLMLYSLLHFFNPVPRPMEWGHLYLGLDFHFN